MRGAKAEMSKAQLRRMPDESKSDGADGSKDGETEAHGSEEGTRGSSGPQNGT